MGRSSRASTYSVLGDGSDLRGLAEAMLTSQGKAQPKR